jgi:hypothetical protein
LDEAEAAEESARVMAVSFAAAALLLLVDLDARKLREEGVDELAQRVKYLYDVIRKLSESLDVCTKELSKHLAGNPANRPPDPEAKHYTALVLYRRRRVEGRERFFDWPEPSYDPRDGHGPAVHKNASGSRNRHHRLLPRRRG